VIARRVRSVGLVGMLVLLSACGSQSSPQTSSGAPVTIHIETQASGTAPWDAVIKDFEKAYPSIKVQISYVPIATYPQVLLTQLRGGHGPDLMYGSSGSGNPNSLLPLARAGYLYDLSHEPWSSQLPSTFDAYEKIGSARYMFPLDVPVIGVFYNPDLFRQLDVQVPATFSQLLSVCGQIKAKGKAAWVLAGAAPPNTGILSMELAANWVYGPDPSWDAERAAGKVTFSGSLLWKNALQRVIDMNKAGCFEQGVEGVQTEAARQLFASGQAAMYGLPMAAYAATKQLNPNLTIATMPFPGPTPETSYVPVAPSDSLAVNKASPVRSAAVRFIDFLAQPQEARRMATLQGAFSWSDYKQLEEGSLSQSDFQRTGLSWASGYLPTIRAKRVRQLGNLLWPNGKVYDVLGTDIQGLLTGQKTIDGTLSDMDAAWGSSS
jgi:raffinose/stachyose/melibiose transport system substrate-binding protein